MKLVHYALGLVLIAIIGGFIAFSVIDVPVQQQEIVLQIQPESQN